VFVHFVVNLIKEEKGIAKLLNNNYLSACVQWCRQCCFIETLCYFREETKMCTGKDRMHVLLSFCFAKPKDDTVTFEV